MWLEESNNRGGPRGLAVWRKGKETSEVNRTVVLKRGVGERDDLILDSLFNPEPVEIFEDRSYVVEPRCKSDTASQRILNCLEPFDLRLRKSVVKRIAIVKFGLDKRGCHNTGSFRVKSSTDATKITNVEIAGSREAGYLTVK